MTGQIPPYGEHFRLENSPYDITRRYASRRYVLKGDPRWSLISDPASKRWYVMLQGVQVAPVQSTMQQAMDVLLDGASEGYYGMAADIHATCKCVRPGALDKEKKVMVHGLQRGGDNPPLRQVRGSAARL